MSYLDEFDVVWSGGPLLPPRNSRPARIWTMGPPNDPEAEELAKPALDAPRRVYNKKDKAYWEQKRNGADPLRHRPTDAAGPAEAQRVRPTGDTPEHLSDSASGEARTITEDAA